MSWTIDIVKVTELLSKFLKNDQIEFEVRFGKFHNEHQFSSEISEENYDKLIKLLNDNKKAAKEETKECVWISSAEGIRIIYKLDDSANAISKQIQKKIRMDKYDVPQLDIRINLAAEITLENSNKRINFIRMRYRTSFKSKDGLWQFDLSRIIQKEVQDNAKEVFQEIRKQAESNEFQKYEVEMELIDRKVKDTSQILTSLIENIQMIKKSIDTSYQNKAIKEVIYNQIKAIIKKHDFIDFSRNLISKVTSLKRSDLGKIELLNYSVTEKADGERHLLFIDANNRVFLINSNNEVTDISNEVQFKNGNENSLLDCEVVSAKKDKIIAFFDILIFRGVSVTDDYLQQRLQKLQEIFEDYRKGAYQLLIKEFHFSKGNIESYKAYTQESSRIYAICKKVLNTKYPYKIDGIIFTPVDKGYYNKVTYKWKPPEESTIDFLIRLKEKTKDGAIFNLFVGTTSPDDYEQNWKSIFPFIKKGSTYFPILFVPDKQAPAMVSQVYFSNKELKEHGIEDNIIIELGYDVTKGKWFFVKLRPDKTKIYQTNGSIFGNDWYTAINNWEIINKPITRDMIIGKEKVPFYSTPKGKGNIAAMRKYNNFVKSYLYEKYCNKIQWLLESGGGRFGDINKAIANGVKNVLIIDISPDSIQEGRERFMALTKAPKINVYSAVASFSDDLTPLINEINKTEKTNIGPGMFDTVSCQFAIQFFMGSDEMLNAFIDNVHKYLKEDGIFMASYIDGARLNELFEKNRIIPDGTLDFNKNGNTIVSIKKMYVGDTLATVGQKISVYVESIGAATNEYLVNTEYLKKKFSDRFKLVELDTFESRFDKWKNDGDSLSQSEKLYSFLNNYIVFQKKGKKRTTR